MAVPSRVPSLFHTSQPAYHRRQTYDPTRGRFLSVERFGDLIGVSGAAVSDWERGAYRPDAQNRALLVKIVLTLFSYKGLERLEEADALLLAGGYAPLREEEIAKLGLEPDDSSNAATTQPEAPQELGSGAPEAPVLMPEPQLVAEAADDVPTLSAQDQTAPTAPAQAAPAVQPQARAEAPAPPAPGRATMVGLLLALLILLYMGYKSYLTNLLPCPT